MAFWKRNYAKNDVLQTVKAIGGCQSSGEVGKGTRVGHARGQDSGNAARETMTAYAWRCICQNPRNSKAQRVSFMQTYKTNLVVQGSQEEVQAVKRESRCITNM